MSDNGTNYSSNVTVLWKDVESFLFEENNNIFLKFPQQFLPTIQYNNIRNHMIKYGTDINICLKN